MLVIFSGGSGVGKNTVIEHLLQEESFDILPTYTTREPRPNEREGDPYYFIPEARFRALIEQGDFYEYNTVHGHLYGTSRSLFAEKKRSGKILLKDIDVMGTQNLVQILGRDTRIVTIFLRVESKEILAERLRGRHEAEIEKRLSRYDLEQTYQNNYDYIITNNDLNQTLSLCRDIIRFEADGKFPKCSRSNAVDERRVSEWADALSKNRAEVPPVNVAVKNGELSIMEGHNRYLAGLLLGTGVAANVVTPEEVPDCAQSAWESAVERYRKKR